MKKMVQLWLLVMVMIMSALPAAAAGIKAGSFTVSPVVGGYTFDGEQHLKTMPVYGLRAGYNFNRYLGVEGLFDYVHTEGTGHSPTPIANVDAYRYGGDMLLHLLPDSRVVPFLAAGYGGISLKPSGGGTSTRGIFDYGLGAKFFLTDVMALRADLRHLVMDDANDRTIYNYEYTVGLSFQFGGAGAPPAPSRSSLLPRRKRYRRRLLSNRSRPPSRHRADTNTASRSTSCLTSTKPTSGPNSTMRWQRSATS